MKKKHLKSIRKGPFEQTQISKDQNLIRNLLEQRLTNLGWEPIFNRAAEEAKFFDLLIPEPDTTFSVRHPSTGEIRAIAFHFAAFATGTRYVCTMQLPGGAYAQERGYLERGATSVTTISSHDELTYSLPVSSAVTSPEPVREARQLLDRIVTQVAARGIYAHGWTELRRIAFPGSGSWNSLKAWAEQNSLDCELCFSPSSKTAEILFRMRHAQQKLSHRNETHLQEIRLSTAPMIQQSR